MVNVGGRSKGCSTCRRRRVKCDETRPICNRCRKWNWKCDGPKDTTFIPVQTRSSSDLDMGTASAMRGNVTTTEHPWPRRLPQTAPRLKELDVCICYTRQNVQRPGLIVSIIAEIEPYGTPASTADVAKRCVSQQALWSFATMFFGLQNRHPHLARRGYAMYGAALAHLNQELEKTRSGVSDDVITAVATLAVAEVLVPSGRRNYLDHMMGLQKLIGLTDPSTYWPTKHYGFRSAVRFMLVLASLQSNSACLLARPDWKKALRINIPPWEEREQDLWDILAELTVLLAKREDILANYGSNIADITHQVHDLKKQGHALLVRLQALERRAENTESLPPPHLSTAHPTRASSAKATASNRALPILSNTGPPTRPDLTSAMLLHATSIYVLQLLTSPPITLLPSPHQRHHNAYYSSLHLTAAQQTTRAVRAYLQHKRVVDTRDPPVLHLAIGVAWGRLRTDGCAEGQWLRGLMAGRAGLGEFQGLWRTYRWVHCLGD